MWWRRQLPRSGCIRFSRTCVAAFVASGPFWPCPLFASSFPRLLPLRVSSSKLPTLRMADGGVCAQPRPFHILLAHHEPKYTHVRRSEFELRSFVFMVCARPPSAVERMHNAVLDSWRPVFKSAFVPFHRVKMHVPKSRRIQL